MPDKRDEGTNFGWPRIGTMLANFAFFCELGLNGTETETAPTSSAVILYMKQD